MKSFAPFLILAVATLSVLGYWIYHSSRTPSTHQALPPAAATSTDSQTVFSTWETYTDVQYGFSFKYPTYLARKTSEYYKENEVVLQGGGLVVDSQIRDMNCRDILTWYYKEIESVVVDNTTALQIRDASCVAAASGGGMACVLIREVCIPTPSSSVVLTFRKSLEEYSGEHYNEKQVLPKEFLLSDQVLSTFKFIK